MINHMKKTLGVAMIHIVVVVVGVSAAHVSELDP